LTRLQEEARAFRIRDAFLDVPKIAPEPARVRTIGSLSILPETLERLERDQAAHALTLWRGFEAFCERSIGLEASAVLKVVLEAGVERVEELENLGEQLGIEPEPETVEEIATGLAEGWRVVERAG
jgi:hypothetical protein